MSEPEQIGKILERIFPSIVKRAQLMSAETVELVKCRCCGQLTLESELELDGTCPSCMDNILS